VIRVSRLADYAVFLLCETADAGEETLSARELSERTRLSEATSMKVLKLLHQGGMLRSTRGPSGGYALAERPERISLLCILSAVEGPAAATQCTQAHGDGEGCEYAGVCSAKYGWASVNDKLRSVLDGVTLADFLAERRKRAPSPCAAA
jgi:FeS assembly SUF system regulator